MQINAQGINLIKQFEGLRLSAYQDSVGIWTIGYGHTGDEVHAGMVITAAQAAQLLLQDLSHFETGVSELVSVPLNSNQFSALVSFSYNVGLEDLGASTLLRLLNEQNYVGAAQQFPCWDHAGNQVLPGLLRRRMAEQALFLQAV
ncbi:lysozyme [Chitinimonas sp. BJB300]|uniref:lysozyme n=1 Tax=Chitinimonas sp. BJB300 TaxID=1559339 RepID=UPI000C0D44C1|nr:lysozyme [Chitinimonas sp. BJB300]PHV09711.1 muraminidase [Chitinimonas sp. BJB300]TSJ91295.1 lysozyme [Chitinimonas sp. BJB300]